MNKQEVIDGNKLITEFLGYEQCGKAEWEYTYWMIEGKSYMELELKYHSSWDWLMPAYKKFRGLTGMKMPDWLSHCNTIENWIVRVNIEDAHKYLSAAIQWYNTQTQPQ